MALMDCYDITNKALLCDPSFDVDALNWFKSDYSKLRILPDGMEPPMDTRSQMPTRSQIPGPSQMVFELSAQSLVSEEAPFETPALPIEPLSESKSAELGTAEMDFLLFGVGAPARNRNVNGYGLTPAPYSQNWNYQRGQMGWGQMGMSQMRMGKMGMGQIGMPRMGRMRMAQSE